MRAIVRNTYGSPDVLELQEIDKPDVTDDEVLVRVRSGVADTFGPNLQRLAEIKSIYDPDNFFRRNNNVLPAR